MNKMTGSFKQTMEETLKDQNWNSWNKKNMGSFKQKIKKDIMISNGIEELCADCRTALNLYIAFVFAVQTFASAHTLEKFAGTLEWNKKIGFQVCKPHTC